MIPKSSKRILFYLGVVVASTLCAKAQVSPIVVAKQITPERMRQHIEFLASDSLEGRETGKPGQRLAAHYIQNIFRDIALTPYNPQLDSAAYYQPFMLHSRIILSKVDCRLNDTTSKAYKLDYYTKPKSNKQTNISFATEKASGKGLFLSETRLGDAIQTMAKHVKEDSIKQFALALPKKEYKQLKRSQRYIFGTQLALEKDGALYYKRPFARERNAEDFSYKLLDDFREKNPDVTVLIVNQNKAKLLFTKDEQKQLKAGAKAETKQLYISGLSVATKEYIPTENVIGYIEGTSLKDEAVIVCGHYDHVGKMYFNRETKKAQSEICNGADDNASGTAAVIEVARCFAKLAQEGIKPKRSIVFIAFSAEEKGLYGSEYYVRNPLFPLNKTAAVINMDMIGRTDKRHTEKDTYVYAINRKDHNKLKRANKQNGKALGVDVDFTPGLGKRLVLNLASDHRPFVVRDVPSMILTTGDHPDYHTPADDAYKISYNRAAAIAQLAFLNAWTLANE